ncbi:lycopene cyclase domain-containing protein [Cellulosimicrobium cellulans]|uniref:lycopene cyclase domain-containing protein n=1 Tax=Cellulosimicrobium cellulans TaxID=1710 RepID=UPI001963BBD1|nr:lycopene cyclase domain-containing protein [Cellulosimicrobium cellulans]MBN0039312.1 lycopene cyclase domain-containing protein [Cellulosimicrobium cellulans]
MTNIVLNVIVLAVLVVVSWRVLRRLRPGPLVWAAAVMCVLTLVFDTLMIAADLYVFDPDKILGVRLWGAPLEDFAYALAAALGMPVLWTALGARDRDRVADGRAAPDRHSDGRTDEDTR